MLSHSTAEASSEQFWLAWFAIFMPSAPHVTK